MNKKFHNKYLESIVSKIFTDDKELYSAYPPDCVDGPLTAEIAVENLAKIVDFDDPHFKFKVMVDYPFEVVKYNEHYYLAYP
jgi:hypothetical protein